MEQLKLKTNTFQIDFRTLTLSTNLDNDTFTMKHHCDMEILYFLIKGKGKVEKQRI